MNTNYRVVIKKDGPKIIIIILYKNGSYFGFIPRTKRKRLSKNIIETRKDYSSSFGWEYTIQLMETIKEYEV